MNNTHITEGLDHAEAFLRRNPSLPLVSEVSVTGNGQLHVTVHIHLAAAHPAQMQRDIDRIVSAAGARQWRSPNSHTARKAITDELSLVVHLPDDIPIEVSHRLRSLDWPVEVRLRSV